VVTTALSRTNEHAAAVVVEVGVLLQAVEMQLQLVVVWVATALVAAVVAGQHMALRATQQQ